MLDDWNPKIPKSPATPFSSVSTPPTSQSGKALVEELLVKVKATRGNVTPDYLAHCRDIFEAILPILTAREASARAEGRREGIEEAKNIAIPIILAVRAQAATDEWADSADHFHKECGKALADLRALAEKQP